MTSILALSGSLRKGSYNSALLRAVTEAAKGILDVHTDTIADVPPYNFDVETSAFPTSVQRLKDAFSRADGLLLVTPEYNNSVPGVLKNAIDWMSRPPADMPKLFRDKPVALMGAADGMGGTRLAQAAWQPVFRTLGMRAWWGGTLYLANAGTVFDDKGVMVDEKMKERLVQFVEGYKAFILQQG